MTTSFRGRDSMRRACFGCALVVLMVLPACVVSDFDKVGQHESAALGEGGLCDEPEMSSEERGESCDSASEPDAGEDETEPSDLDGGREEFDAAVQAADDADSSTPGAARNDASSADAAQLSCSDVNLLSDIKNCGSCGRDCSAVRARPICENGNCDRICEDFYADCNGDLKLGLSGNGCETRTDSDVANCGECRKRCVAPKEGFVTCDKQVCNGHRIALTNALPGPVYGNATGGGPYALDCPEGQVLTGIDGTGDDIVYGVAARCASLRMTRSGTTLNVTTGVATPTSSVGGIITPPPPVFQLLCPANMVVTGISGTLWYWPGTSALSVRTLTIACSSVRVSGDKVSLVAGSSLSRGTPEAVPAATFSRVCPVPGAVGGLSGRQGAYLDAIAVACGTIDVQDEPAGSVTVSSDALSEASSAQ